MVSPVNLGSVGLPLTQVFLYGLRTQDSASGESQTHDPLIQNLTLNQLSHWARSSFCSVILLLSLPRPQESLSFGLSFSQDTTKNSYLNNYITPWSSDQFDQKDS